MISEEFIPNFVRRNTAWHSRSINELERVLSAKKEKEEHGIYISKNSIINAIKFLYFTNNILRVPFITYQVPRWKKKWRYVNFSYNRPMHHFTDIVFYPNGDCLWEHYDKIGTTGKTEENGIFRLKKSSSMEIFDFAFEKIYR